MPLEVTAKISTATLLPARPNSRNGDSAERLSTSREVQSARREKQQATEEANRARVEEQKASQRLQEAQTEKQRASRRVQEAIGDQREATKTTSAPPRGKIVDVRA